MSGIGQNIFQKYCSELWQVMVRTLDKEMYEQFRSTF
jgi:hypothetical protein